MIERQLHVYCDKCGAEGPYIVGERRPSLLKEVLKLGWKVTDSGGHVCMECVNHPAPTTKAKKEIGTLGQWDHIERAEEKAQEDRSRHWTEPRKEKP